jgi:hypothetical protein
MNRNAGTASGYRELFAVFLSCMWSKMQGNGDLLDMRNRNCSRDRSPTWPLGLTDLSFFEQFATPYTPRFGPVECS